MLVPTPAHGEVVCQVLEAGRHVQVQKPLARSLEDADRMLAAAAASGATLRVMEDYLFFPPLVKLREIVASGEIGEPTAVHMKIVANGLGGWEVPASSYEWQFEQALDGRGMLVFDHGWHQLAVAHWLFGPVRRVFGWVGATEIVPGIVMDAPSTLVWEHHNGVRAVLDISFAPDMYLPLRLLHRRRAGRGHGPGGLRALQPDQRPRHPGAVGGRLPRRGRARLPRDRRPPHGRVRRLDRPRPGVVRGVTRSELVMDGPRSREVLVTLLAALESSRLERPIDIG